MAKITVEINTDGAAFDGENLKSEVARIFKYLSTVHLPARGSLELMLHDINGDLCGELLYGEVNLELFTIHYRYGEHEADEVYAAKDNSHARARAYLLKTYGHDWMDKPNWLTIDGVYKFDTVISEIGDPFSVEIKL